MFLYKLLSYYSILFLVYKIIKSKLKKYDIELNKNINKNNDIELNKNNDIELNKNNDIELNKNINKNNDIELNKNINKNINKNNDIELNKNDNINKKLFPKILVKENNNKKIEIEENNQLIIYNNLSLDKNNIDINLLNLSKNELKNKKYKKIFVENCIYNKSIENILIDKDSLNNYIIFNFNVYPEYIYKISVNIKVNNIDNIKIIIKDENDEYTYNHLDNLEYYNYIDYDGINKFDFILDNNEFIINCEDNIQNKLIYIYIYFYNKNEIIIENITYNVFQKNIIKSQESLIIYNVNNSIYPIFTNVCNILDYIEDENLLFFL
jgi:hypothetical protein